LPPPPPQELAVAAAAPSLELTEAVSTPSLVVVVAGREQLAGEPSWSGTRSGAARWLVASSLFGWLVADGWCWFVLREEYCWLVAGGWFVVREKYYWLVADKPSEHGVRPWSLAGGSSALCGSREKGNKKGKKGPLCESPVWVAIISVGPK
jgi:hypothetical protein